MRIGILEDDTALAAQLDAMLTVAGHRCTIFHSGRKLISYLGHETVDLLLLDWNVPEMSGLDVIRWQKQHLDVQAPVLMLTSRTAEEDIVAALQEGADDFIIKPVGARVLLARIEVAERRAYSTPANAETEAYRGYLFDLRSKSIKLEGEPIPVAGKEFALALLLFRNMHRTLSRSYILEAIWGLGPELKTRTLDAHISKLRVKLHLRAENGLKLAPVYAYGYRLEAVD